LHATHPLCYILGYWNHNDNDTDTSQATRAELLKQKEERETATTPDGVL
jgi:hypothetical protein